MSLFSCASTEEEQYLAKTAISARIKPTILSHTSRAKLGERGSDWWPMLVVSGGQLLSHLGPLAQWVNVIVSPGKENIGPPSPNLTGPNAE